MVSGSLTARVTLALAAVLALGAGGPTAASADGAAVPAAAPAQVPVPVSVASTRVEALSKLLKHRDAANEEINAALDGVVEAYGALGPDPAASGESSAQADEAFRVESSKFRKAAEKEAVDALCLVNVPQGSNQNTRHPVQIHAAAAIRLLGPEVGVRYRAALETRILSDSSYEKEAVFYEQAFATLAELIGTKAFDWLLDRAINAEADPDSTRKAIAAIRLMASMRGALGEQRRQALDRIHGLYQSYEYRWPNKYEAVAGFRGGSRVWTSYWSVMRPVLMDAMRILGTDPRTGFPPLDAKTGGDVETFTDYVNWYAGHHTAGAPPWADPKPPPGDGEGPDGPNRHVSAAIPIYWREYGTPWSDWWQRNRRLSPPKAAPEAAAAGESYRAELREKILPPLVEESLFSPAREVRAVAAIALARLGGKETVSRLQLLLTEDRSQRVREAAALALALVPGEDFAELARQMAANGKENPRVRAHAILALGARGDTAWLLEWARAFHPLSEGPREVLHDLEACAVRALSLSGDAKEAAALAEVLAARKQSLEARSAAASALAQIPCPDQRKLLLGMVKEARPNEAELVPQTEAAIALPRAIEEKDAAAIKQIRAYLERDQGQFGGVRSHLAIALGRIGGPDAETLLSDAYAQTKKDTTRYAERGWFLLGLGLHGGSAAQTLLRGEWRSLDDEQDAGACAIALALAGSKTLLPEIRDRVRASKAEFTANGLVALALLSDPEVASIAREVLAHRSDSDVIREGALALALSLGPAAAPDLAALWERCRLPEENDALARAYRFAAGPASVEFLVSILHDMKRPGLERGYALAALSRMTAKDDDSALDRLARDLDPFAVSPTLTAIGRSRDVPFLE